MKLLKMTKKGRKFAESALIQKMIQDEREPMTENVMQMARSVIELFKEEMDRLEDGPDKVVLLCMVSHHLAEGFDLSLGTLHEKPYINAV